MTKIEFDDEFKIIKTAAALNPKELEEVKRQWHNRYSKKKIPKPIEFDSQWIRFKKWGKFCLKILIIISVFVSCEYCRREFNEEWKKDMAFHMMIMKNRIERLQELDGKN